MQKEGLIIQHFIISYLQLSFKMMQYLKTMTLPNLAAYSIFQSSPYQQGNSYYQKSIKYTNPSINASSNSNPRNPVISKPVKIINSNNMHEEVSQFNKKNLLEFCMKVSIIWLISAILMMTNIINYTFGVSLGIFCFAVLIPSHNIIESAPIRKWINVILLFASLILVYVIFMGILNILDKQLATNLDKTQLSFIPCIIITHVLVLCYSFQPLLTIQCRKNIKQSVYYYSTSLSDLFTEILHLNLIIIKVYSLSFLITYIIIAWVNYYHILNNANSYLNIFHPFVLLSQFFTFFYMVIIYHFMIYIIDSVICWKLLSKLYKSKNRFTKIPTMVELLKVSPTEQMVKQLKANGLLVYFNLFSKQQSRISNNLNLQYTNNIYERCLLWILKQVIYKGGNIKNKLQMYCNPSSTYITEVKKQINYWDYIKQFSHLEFSRTLKILYEINRKIQELNIKRNNKKSIFTDLFYDIRLWYYEIQILRLAVLCGSFLKICDLIFEVICSAEISLKVQGGLSVILYQEIQQIRMLAQKIQKTEWVNEIIRMQMQKLQCKTGYILRQSGN